MASQMKAHNEDNLEDRLAFYSHLPFERHAAHLFFQLVSRCYERGSILITSNRSVGEKGEVFGDAVVATAFLDRLLHHGHMLPITGEATGCARSATPACWRTRLLAGEGGVVSVRACRGAGPECPSRFADGVPPVHALDESSGFLSPSQGVSFHFAKGSGSAPRRWGIVMTLPLGNEMTLDMQRPPEEPANAPSASAGGASEAAGEGEPPSSPSTPEPEPFVLRVHLTRLFGTDLTLIPGIGESTALTLFAEIGADMSRFPDAAHLASWLNLCPQNKITGGRVISSKTGPASNRAAQALRMATQSLYRSQTSLGDYFRRKRARLGTPQAITASAHKMARIIYHLVTHHVLYDDDVLFRQQHRDRKRREHNLRHQARALGFDLVPQAA